MPSKATRAVPNRIAEVREKLDLDRTRLAADLGVSERTVYRWEIGEAQVPDSRKADLADRLKVSVGHLFDWAA